jgi:flagellar basal-body rod modification protein FlgD
VSTTISSIAPTGTTGTGTDKTQSQDQMGLDKDAFLKLLVEQLKNQDPSQPGDSQQYIQQMTQYSMLEQLTNISEAVQTQQAGSTATTAMSLVGHTITWKDDAGATQSGVVDKVSFGDQGATLTVGATSGIQLSAISEVK